MRFLAILTLISFSISLIGQQHSKVTIQATELVPNVWRIQGSGGNIGVIIDGDSIIMIDAQYRKVSEQIDSTIRAITGGKQADILINTHWHNDHTGGNSFFGKFTTGIGHRNMKDRLETGQKLSFLNSKFAPAEEVALPDQIFDSSLIIKVGKTIIELWHPSPSHTDGDAIIFIPSKQVIHMGDCLFSDMYPYIDLESGGNPFGYIATLKQVFNRINRNTQLIAGHGPVYNKLQLKEYINMLETIAHRVMQHKNIPLQEVIELDLLEDIDQKWGNGFIHKDQIVEFFWISAQ